MEKNRIDYLFLMSHMSHRDKSKISVPADLIFYRVVDHKNLSGMALTFHRKPNQLIFSVTPFVGVLHTRKTILDMCI